ncbi:hypothetical protein [Sphingomonas morindae]|uniref:DUF883 domain-containing protein n=1 Tax=Sphingomonas morindae TaxID=1541170 RepID=A0ABY4X897_9SPHN|nr:hypothetical protein [Sphingomonas morindae]USI73152.1 hypothetical protein LHA26_01325 [Sphingomonas morindae]
MVTDTATGATAGASTTAAKPQIVDQVKSFAKQRPYAVATLAGVLGVALLNTLRGK